MASVGGRIKARRTDLGMTQGALAKNVGVSQATLSDLENNPTVQTRAIAKFAAVLGVNALWLAEGTGAMVSDGTNTIQPPAIPPNVLRLAERLVLLPDEKLKALSVLVGMKF